MPVSGRHARKVLSAYHMSTFFPALSCPATAFSTMCRRTAPDIRQQQQQMQMVFGRRMNTEIKRAVLVFGLYAVAEQEK